MRTRRTAGPRDTATTRASQPTKPLLTLKLPHERDETPDPTAGRDRATMARAAADVAAGRTDTDCYGAARGVLRRARRGRSQ